MLQFFLLLQKILGVTSHIGGWPRHQAMNLDNESGFSFRSAIAYNHVVLRIVNNFGNQVF